MACEGPRFAPCKSSAELGLLPEIRWTSTWPHKAEVPARRGGAWHLTVQLQPEDKPFAWTVCHSTGLPERNGGCHKLDFAIHGAEVAAGEMDIAEVPQREPRYAQTE
jgi:hypothetical protein